MKFFFFFVYIINLACKNISRSFAYVFTNKPVTHMGFILNDLIVGKSFKRNANGNIYIYINEKNIVSNRRTNVFTF